MNPVICIHFWHMLSDKPVAAAAVTGEQTIVISKATNHSDHMEYTGLLTAYRKQSNNVIPITYGMNNLFRTLLARLSVTR